MGGGRQDVGHRHHSSCLVGVAFCFVGEPFAQLGELLAELAQVLHVHQALEPTFYHEGWATSGWWIEKQEQVK